MLRRILAAGLASAAVILGLALPAGATVTTVAATPDLAGYQVAGNGLRAYNDARATFTEAPGSTSNAAVYLQESVNTGGFTAELALVRGTAACPGMYELQAGTGTVAAPGPLPAAALSTAGLGGTVTCVPAGQPYYLEVHYSTLLRTAAFVAGRSEFGDTNTLGQVVAGFRLFRAPALGAHYTSLPVLPSVSAPQVSLTRVGLTLLLDPTARRGGTSGRIGFASQSLTEVVATPSGGPVTVANRAYLVPSGFGAGSSFSVVAAP